MEKILEIHVEKIKGYYCICKILELKDGNVLRTDPIFSFKDWNIAHELARVIAKELQVILTDVSRG